MSKNKSTTLIALFLLFAIAVSPIVVLFANAQTYEIYMRNYNETAVIDTDVQLRCEVREDGSRIRHEWDNVTLNVRTPGSSSWTSIPMDPGDFSSGRLNYYYTVTELGIYEFYWNVPAPQQELPANPSTSDGSWDSEVSESEVVLRIERATFAYLGALPNPVGVNQDVLFHVGITQQLSIVGMGWEDLTITIERPDNKTDIIDDITTDSTGGTGRMYVPDIPGNYTCQGHFPEQQTVPGKTTPGSATGTWMLASDSNIVTLVVQDEPLDFYPGHPLPTEYWTRPIDPQLREWYSSAGSWLVSTPDNKFVSMNEEAPDTAHIIWTNPLITGGLVGGDVGLESSINEGPVGFETGDAYQGKWSSRFIIAGKVIYAHNTGCRPLEYTCVDIRTGEELWKTTFLDNRSISMCQLFYWETYNYMGTYAYIWVTVGSTWYAFDPFDTTLRITMENVPSGSTIVGERGEIYRYSISTSRNTMTMWNMSALISMTGSFRGTGHNTYDAGGSNPSTSSQLRAWCLNITIPDGLSGSTLGVWLNDRVVGGSISYDEVSMWGFSLVPGSEGNLLFQNSWTAPAYWEEGDLTISGFNGGWVATSNDPYVAVMLIKETREHYGFSLETGKYIWGPTEPTYYLDSVEDSASDVRCIAYGNLYSASVGGVCYCFNATTGELQWKYEAMDPYHDYLMANHWWLKPVFITDGKIYLGHTEHSANQPMPRGAPFICLNATSGEEVWRINGAFRQTRWGGRAIIGDSVIVTMDTYDQRVYAIGKGASAMTVSALPKISVEGDNVLVEGMVTDVSPGTNDVKLRLRFPNSVPAVSDESMSEWMLHVYKQFEKPADVTGVEVVVSVLDPNNNCYEVARATSDASGHFGCTFEPEVPGFYTVVATFEGSGGYYGSYAETFINVEEAPAATPMPTPEPASIADLYLVPGIVGIIVAIAVVGAIIILLLRKR
jgi:outer membrane protein assembly factor BamB